MRNGYNLIRIRGVYEEKLKRDETLPQIIDIPILYNLQINRDTNLSLSDFLFSIGVPLEEPLRTSSLPSRPLWLNHQTMFNIWIMNAHRYYNDRLNIFQSRRLYSTKVKIATNHLLLFITTSYQYKEPIIIVELNGNYPPFPFIYLFTTSSNVHVNQHLHHIYLNNGTCNLSSQDAMLICDWFIPPTSFPWQAFLLISGRLQFSLNPSLFVG